MSEISGERRAFAHYLRTGRRVPVSAFAPSEATVEHKFNPYHDPRNGRFTFAPYGASTYRTAAKPRRAPTPRRTLLEQRIEAAEGKTGTRLPGSFDDGLFRPGEASRLLRPVAGTPRRPRGMGHNSRAAHDPITLEQAFPGLRNAPAGAVIGLADGIFGFTAPADAAIDTLYQAERRGLIADIQKLRPSFRAGEMSNSFDGMVNVGTG